jgi:class 3 adenylate cyclase
MVLHNAKMCPGANHIECGSCRHHNEPNAKFCSECGAPLAARCVSCQAEQPPGSKFCNQCGTPVADVPPHTSPSTGPPTSAAVRTNVTALFADLVGSTSFGEQVDPEAARAALAPYFEILQSTVEDHAGTVAKFTGDAVMAIFGIPEVAEDDALRAVAAGQALQRRFMAFAEGVREQHGVELGLRVGINTGLLVIGNNDADMVGDVLNTAARLEAACQPGRVLVGEDTWRLTRSAVSYEVLGEVRVKGVDGRTDRLDGQCAAVPPHDSNSSRLRRGSPGIATQSSQSPTAR